MMRDSLHKILLGSFLIPAVLFAEYKDKISGDKAFRDGDYSSAASFYGRYLEEAKRSGDPEKERDAYERRIDALILSRSPDEAEKLLRNYKLNFTGADPIAVTMWNAEILLLKNQAEEAKKEIERIYSALTSDNPRRVHAVLLLARAHEKLNDYAGAAELYFSIASPKRKKNVPRQELAAWERGIFCLAFTPKAEEGLTMILDYPELLAAERKDSLQLLTCFIMMKLEPGKKPAALWNQCRALEGNKKNDLSYPVFSAIGDDAAAAKDLETAVEAYASAYEYAPDNHTAFQTLQRLLFVINAAEKKEIAADLAIRTLELFRGDYATVSFREQIAEILKDAKKYQETERVFLNILLDPSATESSKHHAACNLAKLEGKIKLSAESLTLLDQYFSGEKNGERNFLYGESLLEEQKYELAEEIFRSIAEQYPVWKNRSLYQAAYCNLSSGKAEEAQQILKQLFQEKPSGKLEADAVFLQARVLEELGEQMEAYRMFQNYTKHPEKTEQFQIQALFRSGKLAFLSGDPDRALLAFDQLINDFPKLPQSADAANWKIYIYRSVGNDYHADRATYELSKAWPDSQISFDALFLLAENNFATESFHKVDQSLQALFQQTKDPENQAKVLCGRAALALYNKKYPETKALLDRIAAEYPESKVAAEAFYLRGDLLRSTGDHVQALEAYRKVLQMNPIQHLKLAALGSVGDTCFTLCGKQQPQMEYSEALTAYQTLLQEKDLAPGFRAMALYKAGRTLELMGKDDNAAAHYKEALYLPSGFQTPAARLWCTKAAEAIYTIAEKRPTRIHIENAAAALTLLEQFQIIPEGTAGKRTEILKKSRFRPYGSR